MLTRSVLFACGLALVASDGCSDRVADGEEFEVGESPAPGERGGLCLAPDGHCSAAGTVCNREGNYCYDPDDPCDGFGCGGSVRGTCSPVDGQPACTCEDGFDNTQYALFCCPSDGSDPNCS